MYTFLKYIRNMHEKHSDQTKQTCCLINVYAMRGSNPRPLVTAARLLSCPLNQIVRQCEELKALYYIQKICSDFIHHYGNPRSGLSYMLSKLKRFYSQTHWAHPYKIAAVIRITQVHRRECPREIEFRFETKSLLVQVRK